MFGLYLASGRHKIGKDKGLLEQPDKIGIKHHTNTTDSGSIFFHPIVSEHSRYYTPCHILISA
jgi:hypothetical protein